MHESGNAPMAKYAVKIGIAILSSTSTIISTLILLPAAGESLIRLLSHPSKTK